MVVQCSPPSTQVLHGSNVFLIINFWMLYFNKCILTKTDLMEYQIYSISPTRGSGHLKIRGFSKIESILRPINVVTSFELNIFSN